MFLCSYAIPKRMNIFLLTAALELKFWCIQSYVALFLTNSRIFFRCDVLLFFASGFWLATYTLAVEAKHLLPQAATREKDEL